MKLIVKQLATGTTMVFQTEASDHQKWAVAWSPKDAVILYSSDVGTHAYDIKVPNIVERPADATEREIGRKAYEAKYEKLPSTGQESSSANAVDVGSGRFDINQVLQWVAALQALDRKDGLNAPARNGADQRPGRSGHRSLPHVIRAARRLGANEEDIAGTYELVKPTVTTHSSAATEHGVLAERE